MAEGTSEPRRIVKDLPLTRLLPNMITLMSLCSGLTAIRFALHEKWEYAAIAIIIAAVFDMLDGRVARMLNITSKFGAELDSLSDCISFGVVPGMVLYLWTLKDSPSLGWIAVLIYAVCAALRLARFNTMLEDSAAPAWAKSYFTGVPAPGGAGLALMPLFAYLEFGDVATIPPTLYAVWLIVCGGLMVSRVPTLALKGWRIAPIWVVPIYVGAALLIAEFVTNTWLAMTVICVVYLASLPFGWVSYRARLMKDKKEGMKHA